MILVACFGRIPRFCFFLGSPSIDPIWAYPDPPSSSSSLSIEDGDSKMTLFYGMFEIKLYIFKIKNVTNQKFLLDTYSLLFYRGVRIRDYKGIDNVPKYCLL